MPDILQANLGRAGIRLRALGFDSLEQIIDAAIAAGPELSAIVEDDIGQVIAPARAMAQAISLAEREELDRLPCSLGANLEASAAAPDLPIALGLALPPTTAAKSYVHQMPPIRDQATRGTCVAFASLAAYEHYLTAHDAYKDMIDNQPAPYRAFALASERVAPALAARAAAMNASRSPSSTAAGLPVSVPVRKSFTN